MGIFRAECRTIVNHAVLHALRRQLHVQGVSHPDRGTSFAGGRSVERGPMDEHVAEGSWSAKRSNRMQAR